MDNKKFRKRLEEMDKLLLEMNNNRDDETLKMIELLNEIKTSHPDLYQYLILRSMKDGSILTNANYNYVRVLQLNVTALMEVHEENRALKVEVEALKQFNTTTRIFKWVIGLLIGVLVFIIAWFMSIHNPDGTERAIGLLERLSKIFLVFGGS